jgi:hypothetical protein
MRRIILLSAASLAQSYCYILSHKLHDLQKRVVELKMCILLFFTALLETFHIKRRNQRDIINVSTCLRKVPVRLVIF